MLKKKLIYLLAAFPGTTLKAIPTEEPIYEVVVNELVQPQYLPIYPDAEHGNKVLWWLPETVRVYKNHLGFDSISLDKDAKGWYIGYILEIVKLNKNDITKAKKEIESIFPEASLKTIETEYVTISSKITKYDKILSKNENMKDFSPFLFKRLYIDEKTANQIITHGEVLSLSIQGSFKQQVHTELSFIKTNSKCVMDKVFLSKKIEDFCNKSNNGFEFSRMKFSKEGLSRVLTSEDILSCGITFQNMENEDKNLGLYFVNHLQDKNIIEYKYKRGRTFIQFKNNDELKNLCGTESYKFEVLKEKKLRNRNFILSSNSINLGEYFMKR